MPGPGTYERGADICASLLGTRAVTQPEASAADKVVSGMRCMRFHLSASTLIDQPLPCTVALRSSFAKLGWYPFLCSDFPLARVWRSCQPPGGSGLKGKFLLLCRGPS